MVQLNSFQAFLQDMFSKTPILPLLAGIEDNALAASYAKAVSAGGIRNIEVTLRTANAIEQIAAIKETAPSMLIGAGTVFTASQVKSSVHAGADYIVSPGFDSTVENACYEHNIAYLPGAVTPTEIQNLQSKGYQHLKFFPASLNGGSAAVKTYGAVFQDIKFCCTGGVSLENMQDYLSLDNVVGVGLSALAPKDLINTKDWDAVTQLIQGANT